MRLFLVSCVKAKGPRAAPAKDLYVSAWFRKARAFVERTGAPWRILSARHGLVSPEQVIAPYERTLLRMRVGERRAWAGGVLAELIPLLDGVDEVVLLAGLRYREFLVAPLVGGGVRVSAPMAGLGIGKQLRWLNRQGSDEHLRR